MEWKDDYSVNLDLIDADHRVLFSLMDKLNKAVRTGKARALLPDMIKNLTEYVAYHFEHEAKIMAQYNYPLMDDHIREHDDASEKIAYFSSVVRTAADENTAKDLLEFLFGWITIHIEDSDRRLASFIRAMQGR